MEVDPALVQKFLQTKEESLKLLLEDFGGQVQVGKCVCGMKTQGFRRFSMACCLCWCCCSAADSLAIRELAKEQGTCEH